MMLLYKAPAEMEITIKLQHRLCLAVSRSPFHFLGIDAHKGRIYISQVFIESVLNVSSKRDNLWLACLDWLIK